MEKQEVKIWTEKYEVGSQRNKGNKVQSVLCLKAYSILSCPGTFLPEFLPTKLYPESKQERQRMGVPDTPGAKLAFLCVHSHCSKWSHLLFSYLFIILNFWMPTLSPFNSQATVSRTLGERQKCIKFTIKAISEVPRYPNGCKSILVHITGSITVHAFYTAFRFDSFNMPPWMETTRNISKDSGKVLWEQLLWKPCFFTLAFIHAKNMTGLEYGLLFSNQVPHADHR